MSPAALRAVGSDRTPSGARSCSGGATPAEGSPPGASVSAVLLENGPFTTCAHAIFARSAHRWHRFMICVRVMRCSFVQSRSLGRIPAETTSPIHHGLTPRDQASRVSRTAGHETCEASQRWRGACAREKRALLPRRHCLPRGETAWQLVEQPLRRIRASLCCARESARMAFPPRRFLQLRVAPVVNASKCSHLQASRAGVVRSFANRQGSACSKRMGRPALQRSLRRPKGSCSQ